MQFLKQVYVFYTLVFIQNINLVVTVTMEQFEQSLDMMRAGCAPKFKVSIEILDKLRNGIFIEDSQEVKCYSKCVAQLAGTLTKKGDFSIPKAKAQIPIILPAEIQSTATAALDACKDVQKQYEDTCDRVYYVTKCVHDFHPASFKFP